MIPTAIIAFLIGFVASSSAYTVERVEESPVCNLCDSPHWSIPNQCLYYVDGTGLQDVAFILRYDPKTHRVFNASIKNEPNNLTMATFITPVADECDEFVVGMGLQLGLVEWDGESRTAQYERSILVVDEDPTNNFNDGKVDPRGRMYAGTNRKRLCDDLDEPTFGNLYRVDPDGSTAALFPPDFVRVSNGICFNEALNESYYIDSCAMDVKVYDWNPETGDFDNGQTLVRFPPKNNYFIPDGMTIDSAGNLWVALFGAGIISKINRQLAEIEMEIEIPAPAVTSVAFGGENLDEMYVTTGARNIFEVDAPISGGQLYRILGLGVRGLEMKSARVPK